MPPPPTRLGNVQRVLGMIWLSIRIHWQTLLEAIRRNGLLALTRIPQIRDAASAKMFSMTSSGFVAYEDTTIVPSLVKQANGIVLELGPGPGNQLHRFDPSRVEYIYGIELNADFKKDIGAKVEKNGLAGRYKLVVAGIEDSDVLAGEGVVEGSVDTVLCMQVLCAVDDPKSVMKEVYRFLKPGGRFIFWEHGRSRDGLTSVTQSLLNPAWSAFVGCHMTRNVLADILGGGEWENPQEIQEPEDPLGLLPRIQGVLIKKE